jgi:hypothetical protein
VSSTSGQGDLARDLLTISWKREFDALGEKLTREMILPFQHAAVGSGVPRRACWVQAKAGQSLNEKTSTVDQVGFASKSVSIVIFCIKNIIFLNL